MPKAKGASEKDMFGHPVRKRVDKYERMLAKSDKETFASRVERLKFVDGIIGNIGMLGSMETVFIFREAGWAYINGAFISTIMLSQAFIERRLHDLMFEKGFESEAKHGAQSIIKFCRKNQLVSDFLLDKFDRLRQIRNPFVHVKSSDHPFSLDQRMFTEKIQPNDLIENDAKEALSLMYTLLLTRL
ncbi:MAG: hypothetical protein JNJ43_18370 [Anaerolineales bacterium]|nr:hypothetical protein [Anaerolineales bacterium]